MRLEWVETGLFALAAAASKRRGKAVQGAKRAVRLCGKEIFAQASGDRALPRRESLVGDR
jgi:hypothetical protein